MPEFTCTTKYTVDTRAAFQALLHKMQKPARSTWYTGRFTKHSFCRVQSTEMLAISGTAAPCHLQGKSTLQTSSDDGSKHSRVRSRTEGDYSSTECQTKAAWHHIPTLDQVGTALMSFSIGEVSASGPFFTCRQPGRSKRGDAHTDMQCSALRSGPQHPAEAQSLAILQHSL